MLSRQDHGDTGEGVYARPERELSEAQRPNMYPDLQPHPHHWCHVVHHLWNQSRGLPFHLFVSDRDSGSNGDNWVFFVFCSKQEDGDYIIFTNSITSFQLPNETIVRRRTVNIDFSCRFPKLLSISSGFNMRDSDFIFTETNFGTFGYSFDIYPDSNFTEKMQARAYPVSVRLLQTIYMGIQAKSDLPNVKVFVESCKGTPDDNSDNPIYYDLIKDG